MVGLRIKERVDGYEIEGEEEAVEPSEILELYRREVNEDDCGGGFLPTGGEDNGPEIRGYANDDGHGGGFILTKDYEVENLDEDGGGFMPVEDDSGMESEEYIDDGGGGFLSE